MSEVSEKTLVLNAKQVSQKIRRIAFEIYENNFSEKVVVLAGLEGQGYEFAKILEKELKSISTLDTLLTKVSLNKFASTQSEVSLDVAVKDLKKKSIILVDDVLNTGRTLAYAMKPFLEIEIKKIEVAVLVNRSHTLFPIVPTYSGFELATTFNEHVEVKLGKNAAVYLR
ncbi:MAG: phosphoribosyltransferase [Bacteroidetes bacterium]|nr:phosphoribosyltransferase [Bacteroidota bacterium]